MTVHDQLVAIFRDVFDDEDLELTDATTADDVEGWDSVAHITLMFAIEQRMGVQFSDDELGGFKDVGELREAVERKSSKA